MSEWSVVNLSDTDQGHRLDPEYYRPRYLCYSRAVSGGEKLGDKATIVHPAEIRRIYAETGVQILLAQNIRRNRLDFTTTVYMPHTVTKEIARNRLVTDDVVITRSGANFGDAAVYKGTPPGLHACADCLIVRPRGIVGGYLSSYLSTEVGRALLRRGAYGMAQPHIAPRYVRTLAVPRLGEVFERDIDRLVAEAYELEGQSRALCAEADVLLAGELGLEQVDLSDQLAYDARCSGLFVAKRWDAEFYQPKYEQVLNAVRSYMHGFEPLLKNIDEVRPGFDARRHPERVFSYIELSDLNSSLGLVVSASQVLGGEAPGRAGRRVDNGDALASSVAGSVDRVALVGEKFAGSLASTGFFQFRSKVYDPCYVLVLLRSTAVRMQLEREATGAILSAVPRRSLERVIVPSIPAAARESIAARVAEAHSAYRDAERLLDEAKRRVEQMLEQEAKT